MSNNLSNNYRVVRATDSSGNPSWVLAKDDPANVYLPSGEATGLGQLGGPRILYDPTAAHAKEGQFLLGISQPGIGYMASDLSGSNAEINRRVDALQSSFKALAKSLNESNSQDELKQGIRSIQEQFEQLQNASKDLTARVVLPPSEELEVRLVTTHFLDRLEEYRSNQNIWAAGVGVFGGAAMGFLVNFFTGAEITRIAFALMGIFLLVACIFAYFFHVDSQRVERIKGKSFHRDAAVLAKDSLEPPTGDE